MDDEVKKEPVKEAPDKRVMITKGSLSKYRKVSELGKYLSAGWVRK